MNFFTQLFTLGQGLDINLRIKGKNGKLTVSVEPLHQNVSKLKPLVLTGTPEEMDEGFIAQFDGVVTVAKGLITNLDEVRKDAADLEKKEPPKTADKPAAGKGNKTDKGNAAGKPSGKAKAKPREKKATPVKTEPGDMFNQPAIEPIEADSDNSESSGEQTDERVDESLSQQPNVSEE